MNNHPSRKTTRLITLLLVAALLTTGWLALRSVTVTANAPLQGANGLTAPTPAPQPANENNSPRVSPLVGILVLLAPLVYLVWKSRGMKEPKITSTCCLPVIDENQRPFQILEDKPASEKENTN